jgi:hypothetical protein
MLQEITHKTCPGCGADMKEEGRKDKHTNGHYNEWRRFKCGAVIRWSPNFTAEHNNTLCPKSGAGKAIADRRLKAKDKLNTYVGKMDVDEAFKARVRESYRYL